MTYPEPLDVGAVRETMPRSDWPIMRTYTVRSLDHAAGEMVIDFVVHGDTGVAGPWALAARPGRRARPPGPGGAYTPAADVDAHVLIGDEAALPAIAAACERVAPGTPVHVFVEVDGPDDELALASPGRADGALGAPRRGRGPARGGAGRGVARGLACRPSCTARPAR